MLSKWWRANFKPIKEKEENENSERTPLVQSEKEDEIVPATFTNAEDECYENLEIRHKKNPNKFLQWFIPRLLYYIPFLDWILSYSIRNNLKGDVIAALSVGIMIVPQGLAYSFLARVPPIHGLYTSFVPLIVYTIFGNSRQLAIGPEALISILVN